jgi:cell division protein FtsI (penicillin-binding protein 3)
MTAAQMKKMMQQVVLEGTGRKAILEGYSSAGKTGTAQKVDPATRAYSRTKYVASFAGFAPINNPAIVVAVILDSAVGLHQGGQVAAPVFQRISQQVLEYLHVQHDVDLPSSRQVLIARRNVREDELAEASPDHLGSGLDAADSTTLDATIVPPKALAPQSSVENSTSVPDAAPNDVVPAALRQREYAEKATKQSPPTPAPESLPSAGTTAPSAPQTVANGTVVLEVEQGGITVPSFLGKTVRSAVETAQDTGLDLEPLGSGLARSQSPPPGSHVPAGSRVTVNFGRLPSR